MTRKRSVARLGPRGKGGRFLLTGSRASHGAGSGATGGWSAAPAIAAGRFLTTPRRAWGDDEPTAAETTTATFVLNGSDMFPQALAREVREPLSGGVNLSRSSESGLPSSRCPLVRKIPDPIYSLVPRAEPLTSLRRTIPMVQRPAGDRGSRHIAGAPSPLGRWLGRSRTLVAHRSHRRRRTPIERRSREPARERALHTQDPRTRSPCWSLRHDPPASPRQLRRSWRGCQGRTR